MKRAPKSLRSILTLWFLAFTIIPLAFVTGYSTVLYEKSINSELLKRLEGNVREVGVSLADLENYLVTNGKIHSSDPTLIYQVGTRNISASRRIVNEWLKTYSAARMVLFDHEGRLIVAQTRGPTGEIKTQSNLETGDIFLTDKVIVDINKKGQAKIREVEPNVGLDLIVYTRIIQKDGRTAGYLEEVIELGDSFVKSLKKRLNLEAVIFDEKGIPAAASSDDFFLYPKDFFPGKIGTSNYVFFDLTSRGDPFGMTIRKIIDNEGRTYLTLGLAASKTDSQRVLKKIKATLITITLFILLLLIPTLIYVSNRVVKPIYQLVEATQKMEGGNVDLNLPNKSETELGILIDSFNGMTKSISTTKRELESKILELQSTQTTLIQSAKMASLGQLVAGVAHELNNPIGFIHSNMAHLRDYVEKLLRVLKALDKGPEEVDRIKKEVDYNFILEDLLKLITSCEEGARRTRDIVLGLRNFSRLDEAQLKRVDIHEGIKNTLRLLSGELKNRISVYEEYGSLPEVRCYASQLNQVFMNIITNASQAIEKQGEIWIATKAQGSWIEVVIRDNGPGIDQNLLDKVFDPFFTTKPVGRGTGLGLSISYGIIQKHGGEISVKNMEPRGAEFLIRLPVDGPSDTKPSNLS